MIDNDSILWVAHQVSATPVTGAASRKDALVFFMKNHMFSNIYVFQRFTIDADTGKMTIRPDDDLGPDYVLETVKEERLALLTLTPDQPRHGDPQRRRRALEAGAGPAGPEEQGGDREGAPGLLRELPEAAAVRRFLAARGKRARRTRVGLFALFGAAGGRDRLRGRAERSPPGT